MYSDNGARCGPWRRSRGKTIAKIQAATLSAAPGCGSMQRPRGPTIATVQGVGRCDVQGVDRCDGPGSEPLRCSEVLTSATVQRMHCCNIAKGGSLRQSKAFISKPLRWCRLLTNATFQGMDCCNNAWICLCDGPGRGPLRRSQGEPLRWSGHGLARRLRK